MTLAPLFTMQQIPAGDPGSIDTLYQMRALVTAALDDPWALGEARRMVAAASSDPEDVIDAIEDLLRTRVRYQDDPLFVDLLQSPEQLLAQLGTRGVARGDCDDVAILAAFLGAAHGLQYRFRAVGFGSQEPLTHVYTLLYSGAQWVTLDTTRNPVQASPAPVRGIDVEG